VLSASGLLAPGDATPSHRWVVSDAPSQFLRVAQRFLGCAIEHVDTVTLG
jgi:hypothetical protein